ncbi:MAG: arylsulfatase A-like enzyme [Planctomycetota bacterium]|jgi:arylsulfatase A-like enzyme
MGFDQGFDSFRRMKGFEGKASELVKHSTRWVSALEQDSSAPFFLYLHFLVPHGPYTPDGSCVQEFLAGLESKDPIVKQGLVVNLLSGERTLRQLSAADMDYLLTLYDAEIRDVDDAVAELHEFLTSQDLIDSTIIVFTSDHGEGSLEHDSFKRGRHVYGLTNGVLARVDTPESKRGHKSGLRPLAHGTIELQK